MELILWRHADAEESAPDKSRKLTAKGEKQAAQMAEWLKARLPEGALVLASPARRAQQTAKALAEDFETASGLDVGASAAAVLAAAGWPEARRAVVVVGHQPTLGQVAALLLSGDEAEWTIKKGGLWWFTNRVRGEESRVVLRAAMTPELV